VVGVKTFIGAPDGNEENRGAELIRSTEEEKAGQVRSVRDFLARNEAARPAALERLQQTAADGGNVFAELMETVKVASLGSISHALYGVGGQYRRSM